MRLESIRFQKDLGLLSKFLLTLSKYIFMVSNIEVSLGYIFPKIIYKYKKRR